jgi:hypothetical protein
MRAAETQVLKISRNTCSSTSSLPARIAAMVRLATASRTIPARWVPRKSGRKLEHGVTETLGVLCVSLECRVVVRFLNLGELSRLRVRQRLGQDRVHDTENRCVGADAQASLLTATAVRPRFLVSTRQPKRRF